MTAVRFDTSIRYALWIVAYLAAVTILGAGAVGLGLGLGWPTILGWSWLAATLGSTTGGLAYTVGGGLLVLVGVLIVAIGYVSGVYKLVADAIATGTVELERSVAALEVPEVPAGTPTAAPNSPAEPTVDESPSDQFDTEADDEDAVTAEPDLPPETAIEAPGPQEEPDEAPPEPSPEEIAFGSSEPTDEPADEPVDDEPVVEQSGGEDVSPAARGAPSDPLADPTDE